MSAKIARRRSLPVILVLAVLLAAVGALMSTAAEPQGSQIRFEDVSAELALLDLDELQFTSRDCYYQCFTDKDCTPPWPTWPPFEGWPICNKAQECVCAACNGQWGCYQFESYDP